MQRERGIKWEKGEAKKADRDRGRETERRGD